MTTRTTVNSPVLAGARVVITRPRNRSGDLVARLERLGATVTLLPTIAVRPAVESSELLNALRHLDVYDSITFTSVNAVEAVARHWNDAYGAQAVPAPPRIAAVGAATAHAVESWCRAADFVASPSTAKALASSLPLRDHPRILFPAGELATETLSALLRLRGAQVDRITVYRTVPGDGLARLSELLKNREVDVLMFSSPSALTFLLAEMRQEGLPVHEGLPAVVCIGPVTAEAARKLQVDIAAVAESAGADALVRAVMRAWTHNRARTDV